MEAEIKISNVRLGGRGGFLALACLIALSVFPGAASAKQSASMIVAPEACPIRHVQLNVAYFCSLEFSLHASNGYRITVSGDPGDGSRQVRLIAVGPAGTAEYSSEGVVTATTLSASFGHLGKVAVRFRPSGAVRRVKVSKRCLKDRPRTVTSRQGSFLGAIKFRGERGYTKVSARRAQGGLGDPLANTPKKLGCEFRESKAERKRELESVSLDASPPGAGVSFTGFRLFGGSSRRGPRSGSPPSGNRYLFLASAIERAEGMSVTRYTGAIGGSSDFVFDDALTTAEVTPPGPFTGSGNFRRNADGSTSWTGTLSVPLPGLGTVRLTGGGSELATVATHLKQLEEELKSRRAGSP